MRKSCDRRRMSSQDKRGREAARDTHEEAARDVADRAAVRLLLVRVRERERVDDSREPVYELVEVHARRVLARRGRPVVLGQAEEIVEL